MSYSFRLEARIARQRTKAMLKATRNVVTSHLLDPRLRAGAKGDKGWNPLLDSEEV